MSVISLALAAFIFNTTEFIPVALLSDIAASFSLSTSQAGLMLTIYAWMVCLSSLPLMLCTRKLERKGLLLALFVLFVLSHLCAYYASSFTILMLSRIGIACAHAVFWSITAALTIRIAPEGKATQALGLLSTGTVLALVLGIPLGRVFGEWFGWRNTFLLIAIFAAIIAIILWRVLPRVRSHNVGALSSVAILFKRPLLCCLYLVTILAISAQFTAYSYIEPFALNIAKLSSQHTTLLLLLFGAAGILGSYLFSHLFPKIPKLFAPLSIGCLCLCLTLLLPLASLHWGFSLLQILWGASIMGIGLSLQYLVLKNASDATDVAMAIYSGLYNLGIGAGALLGSIISAQFGLAAIAPCAAMIALPACILALYSGLRLSR